MELETRLFLGIVLLAWLIYALKTGRFVLSVLEWNGIIGADVYGFDMRGR